MSGTATVVDVVRAEAHTNELLHQIIGFAGGAAGGDCVDRVAAVLRGRFTEALGCPLQGFVPGSLAELTSSIPYQWMSEPVRVVNVVVGELSFDAQRAFIGRAVKGRLYSDDAVVPGQEVQRAADAAVATDCAGFLDV